MEPMKGARMTEITTPPRSGPWNWWANLPQDGEDLDKFRLAVLVMEPPDNLHVARFLRWVADEVEGRPVSVSSPKVLAKYRRFLYEIAVARGMAPPPKGRDASSAATLHDHRARPLVAAIAHNPRDEGSVEYEPALAQAA